MIAIKVQSNLGNAQKYFEEHLSSGDYYHSGGATPGQWFGKGADALGLQGRVQEIDFLAMCDNVHPQTGQTLTARMNTTRNGGEANRRIFYDFTFCPSKSVSIQALVHGDDRIKEAHEIAVRTALAELEEYASVRVRGKDATTKDRKTGNICAATFTHETSRAVDESATPDPLLHTHACVFNATQEGDSWKALETLGMMKAQSYASAAYDHALCQQLGNLGYEFRETEKGFELAHIDDSTIEKFSKRRKAILEKTAELEKDGATRSHDDLKDAVAHDGRIRKQGPQTASELQKDWQGQMSEAELAVGREAIATTQKDIIYCGQILSVDDSLKWAKEHSFERNCVTTESTLLAEALRRGRGQDWSIEELKATLAGDTELLREVGDSGRVTTQEALGREKFILGCVENGKGQYQPLAAGLLPSASPLNDLQRTAASQILQSRDMVTLFRGGAGTGKSFTLRHVADALEADGKGLVVLAPQNQQVSDLRKDGFTGAKTLSSFLTGKEELSSNSVIIMDESGQVGGEDMAKLMAKAKLAGARIILSGDTRQHGAVAACDSLRAVERFANPHTAELVGEDAIQRQKVEWYKGAVALAEAGDTEGSFHIMEKEGAIRETTIADRAADTARLYLEKSAEGESCLCLSQTNAEVSQLNESIRQVLKNSGKLEQASAIQVESLRSVDLTVAEKQLAKSYGENSVLLLNRKHGQLKAGTEATFLREGENGSIWIRSGDNEVEVAKKELGKLSVCRAETLELCKGDKIQLKANCKIGKNNRLANGQILTFVGQNKHGLLEVADSNGKVHTLPPEFKQLMHGYAVTSYASQGKTVDHVIISDSSSKAATSAKEFYVSISRGRQSVTLLTADKESLRDHIQSLGERDLAMDLRLQSPEGPKVLKKTQDILAKGWLAYYDATEPVVDAAGHPFFKSALSLLTGGASAGWHDPAHQTISGARGMIREKLENYLNGESKKDPRHAENARRGLVGLMRKFDPALHRSKNPRTPKTIEEHARVALFNTLQGDRKESSAPELIETVSRARGVPVPSAVGMVVRHSQMGFGGIVETFENSVGKIFSRGSEGFLQVAKKIGLMNKALEQEWDSSAEIIR